MAEPSSAGSGAHHARTAAADGTLVLASASPRRLELLGRLDLTPRVVPAEVDESVRADERAAAYVTRIAAAKADAVRARFPDAVVLAADTAVVLDGTVLGKPADRDDATVMLTRLSGRTHEVHTAVAVAASDGTLHEASAIAQVTMSVLSRREIQWYLDTGEPFDKAGAYAVQGAGAVLVERVEGDPTTVIGLPLRVAVALLRRARLDWPRAPAPSTPD